MPYTPRAALPTAALLGLALLSSAAWSQVGDPVRGKALYADTPGVSGVPTLTGTCVGCHAPAVTNRRTKISGSTAPSPEITFDQAMTRLTRAIDNVGQMNQFKNLTSDDVESLAAYIADTPRLDATELVFSSAGVNTASAKQMLTLQSPEAPIAPLTIVSIGIAGADVANYQYERNCDNKTFTAGEACGFRVWYEPRNGNKGTPVLTVTLRDGPTGTAYTRNVILKGSIAGSTPTAPSTPSTPSEDSGGGAMGWGVLAALAAASAALGRRRRA